MIAPSLHSVWAKGSNKRTRHLQGNLGHSFLISFRRDTHLMRYEANTGGSFCASKVGHASNSFFCHHEPSSLFIKLISLAAVSFLSVSSALPQNFSSLASQSIAVALAFPNPNLDAATKPAVDLSQAEARPIIRCGDHGHCSDDFCSRRYMPIFWDIGCVLGQYCCVRRVCAGECNPDSNGEGG